MADSLKARQAAGEEVERLMLEFLLQYVPAHDLKVSDVRQIAYAARSLSFEQFSKFGAA